MPRHSPYALVRLNYLPKMFGLSGSLLYRLNCYDNLHFTVNSFFIRQQKLFFYLLFFLEKPDFVKSFSSLYYVCHVYYLLFGFQ